MPETSAAKRPPRYSVDWERAEREYRAGQLSVSEIGRLCGVSHTAINKRAKKHGWTRNLASRVREEVAARLVSEEAPTDAASVAIAHAAARDVEIIRSHRRDIMSGRDMLRTLLDELRESTTERESVGETIEDEKDQRRREAMRRAVSLPGRARVMTDLAGAMKTLVSLERQAFNIDEPPPNAASPTVGEQTYAGLAAAEAYRRMKDGEG